MNKLKLDNVEWKVFKIRDIFEVFEGTNGIQTPTGAYIKKDNLYKGDTPRITVRDTTNGIDSYNYSDDKNYRTFKNFISVSFLGSVFYHPYEASLDMKVHALKIKNKDLSSNIAKFLIRTIKNNTEMSSYGNQISSTDLAQMRILLPVDVKNNPNWQFMEDYIKQEQKDIAEKIVDYYEKKIIDEANILLDLEEVEWRLFQIDKIFDVKKVEGKPINNYENGNIAYVTISSENNGITNFVNYTELHISKRNAISVDPVAGTAFYHDYDFVGRGFSGSSINLLYNDNLNNLNSKFVCSAIEKVSKVKASYGLHFNGNRLKSAKILLPSDKNDEPNWHYMTNFIKKLEHETASKVLDYIYIYRLAICKEREFNLESIEWKEFYLNNIFNLIQRGRRLTKRDQFEGNIPYISSTGFNNGLDNFIGNTDNIRIFNECLSIANSGSVGSTFYHKYEFVGSDHITALKIDKATENIYLFLATQLRSLEIKYSFNREINDRRIRREKIILPAKDDKPDYDFMNKYIAIEKIKSIYKILDYYKGLIKS